MDFMSKDHDRLDGLFKQFQESRNNPKKAKEFFKEFKMGLQRHIVWEEQILFPLFEEKTGMKDTGPTAVMRMEHVQIGEALEKIHAKIRNLDTNTESPEQELLSVLKPHNDKEEGILYPWLDESIEENNKASAFKKMKELPEEAYHKCCGHCH